MIMKKILSILFFLTAFVQNGICDDFSQEQLKLRLDIVKYLSREGYNPSKPDADGDVGFKKDDVNYYVIIDKNWSSPFLITLYAQYGYSETSTQKVIKNCISAVGQQYKTVKLFASSKSYSFRSDVFCENATTFNETFKSLLKEMEDAQDYLFSTIRSGIADIDLSDREAVFKKAKDFYDRDEDEKSFPLFKQLADAGYGRAYGYVAASYQYGYGVAKNYQLMEKYYQKGIDDGYMWCAYRLANYQYDKEEYTKAFSNYMKCGSNENEFKSDALYKVGYMQENGQGVDKNLVLAITSYKRSVQYSKELECDARLALIRLNEPAEKKEDFTDATKTMLMGMSSKEMYDIGYEYEQGLSNRFVSLTKAYAYYKAAADAGYTKAYSKMGEIYISKFYPFNDKAKSDKYYQKVLKIYKQKEERDGDACYELGRMYQNGYGVNIDQEQAKYYYKSGALLGDKNASWRFGLICKDEMDYAEAAKFFERAAEAGQGMAMYELAMLYEQGLGKPTNRAKAIEWYTKCSNSTYIARNDARKALKRLGANDEKE